MDRRTIEKINGRMWRALDHRKGAARYFAPWVREMIDDFSEVRYANLHDASCAGRVCLNPAHEPDGGEVIDVRAIDERKLLA